MTMEDAPTLFDQRLERLYPEERFGGSTYEPAFDAERLGKQAKAVFRLLREDRWWTLRQLSDATGYPEASVSARLRDFRKQKFGGYIVERQRVSGGLWRYRMAGK